MNKSDLQKLRELPIEGVAERLGLQVTRHLCLCPFHDDHHASLSFSARRNTYRCFVCGAHGGTIDLVMRVLNKDFREACGWLSDSLDCFVPRNDAKRQQPTFDASRYERFFERPWLSPEARHFLFDERKLDPKVVRWCRLTSWRDREGIPWLQIPYYNREGQLVGFQNRNLGYGSRVNHEPPTANHEPRFRFPRGAECGIYNLPVLNRLHEGEELWITEGCSDCWAMLSAGHKAVAIPSATLLKPKDLEQLSILNCQLSIEFHMFPDRDAPGESLYLQLREVLPRLVHHQLPAGCKDYSDYYLQTASRARLAQ